MIKPFKKRYLLPTLISSGLMLMGASSLSAQITNPIIAHINHKFTVANATLPPGTYTFQIMPGTDLTVMTVSNKDGTIADEFLVRESEASHVPKHSELVFNRYDGREFLTHVYEQGSRIGVAVAETSRAELRLQKQGKHPYEHTEEQSVS